eukprot:6181099-Pleurochrysis_carterae.AAC.2
MALRRHKSLSLSLSLCGDRAYTCASRVRSGRCVGLCVARARGGRARTRAAPRRPRRLSEAPFEFAAC